MRPFFLKKMIIDEEREFCLNFAQYRKNMRVIETDHNSEILELEIPFSFRKSEREKNFNLRNKVCQEAFKEETENNQRMFEMFENYLPFDI